MKNHIRVNGQLLQTNKRFGALKESQKAWIYDITRLEYRRFIAEHGKQPYKRKKDEVFWAVQARVDERGIWCPSGLSGAVNRHIDRLNRRYAFQLDSEGNVVLDTDGLALITRMTATEKFERDRQRPGYKPPPEQLAYSDLPDEVKAVMVERLTHDILTTFRTTGKPPTDKAKSSFIKMQVKYFNTRKLPQRIKTATGAPITIVADDALRDAFDQLVKSVTENVEAPNNPIL